MPGSLKNSRKEVEFKSYGLYSEVARQVDCTAADVDTIYSWYINTTLDQMNNEHSVKVFLKGLGTIKIDFGRGLRFLKGYITGLDKQVTWYLDKNRPSYLRLSFLIARQKILSETITSMKQRLERYKDMGAIKEAGYMNKLTRLDQLQNQLNLIYESIQRIPEFEQKRTAECGQSTSWGNEPGGESIPTTEQ
jgi:hypothetical protein